MLDTYEAINVAYKASIACYTTFFALFLGCFPVTLAIVFDRVSDCPFFSSEATVMRLKFI